MNEIFTTCNVKTLFFVFISCLKANLVLYYYFSLTFSFSCPQKKPIGYQWPNKVMLFFIAMSLINCY